MIFVTLPSLFCVFMDEYSSNMGMVGLIVKMIWNWKVSLSPMYFNSLWPSDAIWWQSCGSTLVQGISCCHWPWPWHCRSDSHPTWPLCTDPVMALTKIGISLVSLGHTWGQVMCAAHWNRGIAIKSLRPSDAIWQHRSGSTLAQVMAFCLTAPSHYLNQCLLIISEVQWQSY